MPLTLVWFPVAARDFSPSELSVQTLLRVSVHPPCAVPCCKICVLVKDSVVRVRVRWIMETLFKLAPSVHRRLCRATLSQVAFPRESSLNSLGGEIPLGEYSC